MTDLIKHLRASGITYAVEPLFPESPILAITVTGQTAVPLWRKLHSLLARTAHYPVILGDRDSALDRLSDAPTLNPAPIHQTLALAATLNINTWIHAQREFDPDLYADFDEGPWPSSPPAPITTFTIPFDPVTHRPHPVVLVALIPTRVGAEVPAYLRFGSYNDCPESAVHVAFARHWHERYGAQIVGSSSDLIEMTVPHPPTTREAALILAREQYAYCPDLVDQGVETISNLAATLLNSPNWRFWWD